jgi:hypothetical protein
VADLRVGRSGGASASADRKLREVRGVHVTSEDHDEFKARVMKQAARIVAKRAKEQT